MRYPFPVTNPLVATEAEIQECTYRKVTQDRWDDSSILLRIDMESDLEVSFSIEASVEPMIELLYGH